MKKNMKKVLSLILTVVLCTTMMVYVPAKSSKKYVKSISIKKKATIVVPIDQEKLTKSYSVKVKVKGKATKKFSAKSSNKKVATVKVKGKKINVTALKAGKAKITVKTKGKNKKGKKLSKKITITVKKDSITKKSVPYYMFDASAGKIIKEKGDLYFSSAYPDVPFVTDSYAIKTFLEMYGYETTAKETKSKNNHLHSFAMPMNTTVAFDYDKQIMGFSDFTSTLVMNGCMPFNPFGASCPYNTNFFKTQPNDRYDAGEAMVCTFGFDEVPMLIEEDHIFIPLQTFSDLFLSHVGNFMQYNGKGVFIIDASIAKSPAKADYYKMYQDCKKTGKISSALAQVNYYELCNTLDAHYGLQEKHHINTFDAFFERKGYKKKMLSGDLIEITKSEMALARILFEDFHSGDTLQSCYLSKPVDFDPSQISPSFIERNKNMERIVNKRKEVLGETVAPYERRGDTVFITFDSFSFKNSFDSYGPEYEPTPYGDTVDLFAYALRRLQNEDSDAKNVVIDLACNDGGAIIACGFAMEAICGTSNIYLNNPITWAEHSCVQKCDLNLDGVVDENDKSMKQLGFNVAVNISDNSFSCGNLLPNMLKSIDDSIFLTGTKSGGGACAVGFISTAINSVHQISSEAQFVTKKNGQIQDIDAGIEADYKLNLNRMFDRDYIVEVVDKAFGTN